MHLINYLFYVQELVLNKIPIYLDRCCLPRIDKTNQFLSYELKKYLLKLDLCTHWDVFDYIINEERAGFLVNSGQEEFHGLKGDRQAELINELMFKIPVPWASVRFDAFTFYLSFNYLKDKKPQRHTCL